jgi:hypothetical protein
LHHTYPHPVSQHIHHFCSYLSASWFYLCCQAKFCHGHVSRLPNPGTQGQGHSRQMKRCQLMSRCMTSVHKHTVPVSFPDASAKILCGCGLVTQVDWGGHTTSPWAVERDFPPSLHQTPPSWGCVVHPSWLQRFNIASCRLQTTLCLTSWSRHVFNFSPLHHACYKLLP